MLKIDVTVGPTPEVDIPIECPGCKKPSNHKARTLTNGATIACPHCQSEFRIDGNGGADVQAKVDELMADLTAELTNIADFEE
jgi:hypothetical protein